MLDYKILGNEVEINVQILS